MTVNNLTLCGSGAFLLCGEGVLCTDPAGGE